LISLTLKLHLRFVLHGHTLLNPAECHSGTSSLETFIFGFSSLSSYVQLPLISTARMLQVSGTKFYYLENEAVLLELALINLTLS
jgi:seryl-tRNA synthetase